MMAPPALTDAQTAVLAGLGARVSTVAHEMRNALGPVELMSRALAEQCAPLPELAPLSGRLLSGVHRLRAVTTNLLTVARPPALEAARVDAAAVARECVEGASLTVAGTDVIVESNLPPEPAWVRGDAERLRQAIVNLLLNAVQAMPQGGRLSVGVFVAGGRVEVRVRDTGVGMDRPTLTRAGEVFFTTRPHGTGLGLAVVREVAAAHGAAFRLTSRPGRGTTARLILRCIEGDLR